MATQNEINEASAALEHRFSEMRKFISEAELNKEKTEHARKDNAAHQFRLYLYAISTGAGLTLAAGAVIKLFLINP